MPSDKLITRKQYLADSANLHQAYYAQFLTDATRAVVVQRFGKEALLASKDPHFNDIPLAAWDMLAPRIRETCNTKLLGEAEDQPPGRYLWSLGTAVCIAKAVAREIRDNAATDK